VAGAGDAAADGNEPMCHDRVPLCIIAKFSGGWTNSSRSCAAGVRRRGPSRPSPAAAALACGEVASRRVPWSKLRPACGGEGLRATAVPSGAKVGLVAPSDSSLPIRGSITGESCCAPPPLPSGGDTLAGIDGSLGCAGHTQARSCAVTSRRGRCAAAWGLGPAVRELGERLGLRR
jgi:hypothetical protein